MSIINLTQHQATNEQVEAGVVACSRPEVLKVLLTFDSLPTRWEIQEAATELTLLAIQSGCKKAMVGGAPFLMGTLETTLKEAGIQPLYAFSVRESVESTDANGVVTKTARFKHLDFVEV